MRSWKRIVFRNKIGQKGNTGKDDNPSSDHGVDVVFVDRILAARRLGSEFLAERTKGYDSSGVIVKTENSPIVVDTEDLTFHIYSADRFIPVQEYDRRGIVTAEYTFRNPTNLTVETRCRFPFGFVPYDESQTEAGFTRRVLKNCPTAISRFSFARRKIPKGTSRRSER